MNILEEFGDDTEERAIFVEAKKSLNEGDYDSAIAYFETLSATFRADRDVAILYASAYAGRCGLDFLDFISDMDSFTGLVFVFMTTLYPGSTESQFDDCVTAQDIVRNIADADERTDDENTFMAVLNFVVMAKFLNWNADTDDNGVADAGWDACTLTSTDEETDVRNFGAALTNLKASVTALGASAIVGTDQLTTINTVCGLHADLTSMCNKTDPSEFTTDELNAIRTLMFEGQSIGVGTCAASPNSFANCLCT